MEDYTNFNKNRRIYRYIDEGNLTYFKLKENNSVNSLEQLLDYFKTDILDLMTINDITSYINVIHRMPLIFIMLILFSSLEEGSLCINLDSDKKFNRIPKELNNYTRDLLKTFLRYLELGCYDSVIYYKKSKDKKLRPMVVDGSTKCRFLYFQKYHFHEDIIKQQIGCFLSSPINIFNDVNKQKVDSIINKIYLPPLVIRDKKNRPIEKDLLQVEAIRRVFSSNLSVISGGPGTGKTSLLTNILRVLLRVNIDTSKILLGAPTGRSACRISEAIHSNVLTIRNLTPVDAKIIELNGSTLHKILKYSRLKSKFTYRETYKLPISVLILDEASMIDVVLMSQILISLDTATTKLILLGDKNQLPSVGAGSIFTDIITRNETRKNIPIKVTVLEKVYRSTNKLVELAKKINTGEKIYIKSSKFEDALNVSNGEWSFVVSDNRLKENVSLWIQNHYDKDNFFKKIMKLKSLMYSTVSVDENKELQKSLKNLFKVVKKSTILTFTKNGDTGSNEINKQIAEYVRSTVLPNSTMNENIFDGAIIIITQNDYSKSLYNGDVGIIVGDQNNKEYYAFFNRSEKYLVFIISSLFNWDLAFATTVHKSQGSEFDDVMVVLPNNSECKLLTKETLYTGITRAANRVVIYGSKRIFNYAKNRFISRQSGPL